MRKKTGRRMRRRKRGGVALCVSCRGKLARSRDLVIGPVIRHTNVWQKRCQKILQQIITSLKKEEIKAERETRMATNCLKLGGDAMSHVPRLM